jgi:hypothetical protein
MCLRAFQFVQFVNRKGFKMSKIEAFWKDATADDVARVMAGETVEARFRDSETQPWGDCYTLTGWVNERRHQWRSAEAGGRWNFCQVYREPSYWTNKPDPEPGFRLLGKLPDEPKLATDECWNRSERKWQQVRNDDGIQEYQAWYRRRIEVEPKFAVGQMVKVVGPKATDARYWSEKMNQHIGTTSPIKVREKKDDSWFYELGCSVIWAFSEDYLEAVEPEPKHYVLRVGDSFETPSGQLIKVASLDTCQMQYKLKAGFKATLPNGQTITAKEKGFEVTQ